MTQHASGTFEVHLTPDGEAGEPSLGRLAIDKVFTGDLIGRSQGQMLAAGTAVEGSAGYLALERVTGTLHGRSGSFVLQHSGLMNRGAPQLTISVVPDSGTGELEGLAGEMKIDVAEGRHAYELAFTLREATRGA
jgi:hypothetical protein